LLVLKRKSQRVLILKMVLDDGLLNVLMVYAPHSGKPTEEHTHNRFTALLDFVQDYLSELAPEM